MHSNTITNQTKEVFKASIQGIDCSGGRRLSTLRESNTTIPQLRLDTSKVTYNLASYNKQRFLTSKQIRSGQYTKTVVYSLIRLSRNAQEPERSRISSELKNIAKFRNMNWPLMTDKPLQIPFLAHSDFSKSMETKHQQNQCRQNQTNINKKQNRTTKQLEESTEMQQETSHRTLAKSERGKWS